MGGAPPCTLTTPFNAVPTESLTNAPSFNAKGKFDSCAVADDLPTMEYAQYGVGRGKLVTRKIGALSCVIFSRGWPSWCWAAKS